MSIVQDTEKLILEVERPLYNKKLKEYSDRNLKDKLWYEIYESVVTNWSELPAEQKSEKKYVNFLVHTIGDHADNVNIYWIAAYIL
jgi:molybdopterin synthase catalytic subunit